MHSFVRAVLFTTILFGAEARAEPVETEIPNVTAELAELRTDGGVLRLAVRYKNNGSEEAYTDRMEAGRISIADTKSKQKHLPIRDANRHVIGGPIGDDIDGGRLYLRMPPGSEGPPVVVLRAVTGRHDGECRAPPDVSVRGCRRHRGTESDRVGEANTQLAVRRRCHARVRKTCGSIAESTPQARPCGRCRRTGPATRAYFEYRNVYLFDPVAKRSYPVMKDSEGKMQASPITTDIGHGSMIPDWSKPILMSLTMQAPPDDVTRVDLILPDFLPFEGIAIEGLGGAGAGGIAAAGKSLGLEGALKELQAKVEPEEIAIDLSADVLFDFDKADLKPAAETTLGEPPRSGELAPQRSR